MKTTLNDFRIKFKKVPLLYDNESTIKVFHPPNKCSRFLLISLSKFCCRKETWGYAKVIHKKIELKNGHKSVQDIENNRYLDAHLKKEKRR